MEKDFREKLVDYKNKVDDVWDFLREVIDKIREVNCLFVVNQKNMIVLEVRFRII